MFLEVKSFQGTNILACQNKMGVWSKLFRVGNCLEVKLFFGGGGFLQCQNILILIFFIPHNILTPKHFEHQKI